MGCSLPPDTFNRTSIKWQLDELACPQRDLLGGYDKFIVAFSALTV